MPVVAEITPQHAAFMGQLPSRVAALLEQIDPGLLPVVMVVPFNVAYDEAKAVARLPSVAAFLSIVVPKGSSRDRFGSIAANGDWLVPDVAARSVCYLGWSRAIRPRRLFEVMLKGMPWVTALSSTGQWETRFIPAWYVRYLRTRWEQFQVMRHLDMSASHVRHWAPAHRRTMRKLLIGCAATQYQYDRNGKVMLVTGSLGAGGAERQLLNTASALVSCQRETEALCFETGVVEFDFYLERLREQVNVYNFASLAENAIRSHDTATMASLRRIRSGELAAFIKRLPMVLREPVMVATLAFTLTKPAVVHLWQDVTNIVGGIAALLAGVPRIVMAGRNLAPHHYFYFRRYMRPLYGFLLDDSRVTLINNSHAGAASYAKWLGVAASTIPVVYNGIDTTAFRHAALAGSLRAEWGMEPSVQVVGGVFRFSAEKDPLLWLETAALIREHLPECRFVLLGEGSMQTAIEEHARALRLDDVLVLPGITDRVAQALSSFDLLLLSSSGEGLPNVLIEAQLVGCPVITTDAGGAAEAVVDGKTGFVAPQRTAHSLAHYCCRALTDAAWRAQASALGPAHVESHFGLPRMLQSTLGVYEMPPDA